MSQHKKPIQNSTPCVAQATEQWQNQEPSAEELAIVSKSFARCLVEKGYEPRDLIEAANLLLDHAIEEAKAARQPEQANQPAPKAKKRRKGASAGATKLVAAAP